MAGRRLHPIAEAALRAAGKAGRKALENAALEGIHAAADSVLEDIEDKTGGISTKAKEVRTRLRTRKEETMAGRKRRAAEEEVEDEDEEEEEEEEDEEEDEDGDDSVMLYDAEVLIRNAIYLLDACVEGGKVPRKISRNLEEVHEEISKLIDDED